MQTPNARKREIELTGRRAGMSTERLEGAIGRASHRPRRAAWFNALVATGDNLAMRNDAKLLRVPMRSAFNANKRLL